MRSVTAISRVFHCKAIGRAPLVALCFGAVLTACGGGSSESAITPVEPVAPIGSINIEWEEGVFPPPANFKDLCESPRTDNNSVDILGSALDEKFWLRSWTNETYFWYEEVVDQDPNLFDFTEDYFAVLRTTATTASGAPRDQFHFTIDTERFTDLSQSGVSAGYGMQLVFLTDAPPREIRVADVEPGSPADIAGIARGAEIIAVDGVDAINGGSRADTDVLNAGLFPQNLDQTHQFVIQNIGAEETQEVTLTSSEILTVPVRNINTIPTPTGNVGYILFNDHIRPAEAQLIDAVEDLNSGDGIDDLVLDLRYNGGGLLFIASQLAYMIAGPEQINGRFFETLVFNDKFPIFNPATGEVNEPIPFFTTSTAGSQLPSLDLDRVFILASGGTCSASESIINSLRGVGVEVILIGDTTCGKPYGFYATDNCGVSYFTVQFQTLNSEGFGEYPDGFAPSDDVGLGEVSLPGCSAFDDFSSPLGQSTENMLATALAYRATGLCPPSSARSATNGNLEITGKTSVFTPAANPVVVKPLWLQNRDMSMPESFQ